MFIYLVALIAAMGGFLFGFDEGVIAGSLHLLKSEFVIDELSVGVITGALPFGALFGSMLIGALISSQLSKNLGRRRCILLSSVLFILGALLAATAMHSMALIIARFILGIAIGIAAVATPLYIAESAPAPLRGRLVCVYQLAITLGILAAYIINLFLAELLAWRWMFAAGIIPAAIFFFGMLYLPESPRWLVQHQSKEKAKTVLEKLRTDHSSIDQELADIEQALHAETLVSPWKELFSPQIFPALILGVSLFFLQQLSGINAVIYYAPQIFVELGFSKVTTAILATVGIGIVNVLMTIVALWLIDRLGRRKLLLMGFIGTALSLGVISITAIFGVSDNITGWTDWVAVAGLLFYIAAFAISLGPIPYVIMSELFPLNVRGPGMGLSSLSNWFFNSLVVFAFPLMLASIGIGATLGFYALICVAGFTFAWIFMPETKGATLEAIEQHIQSGKPLRTLGRSKDT